MEIANGNLKSEKLSKSEVRSLRIWVDKQPTKRIAADVIGVPMSSLDRIMLAGSGSPENIQKIREAIAA